jgi:hypothetical protein
MGDVEVGEVSLPLREKGLMGTVRLGGLIDGYTSPMFLKVIMSERWGRLGSSSQGPTTD